MYVAFCGSGCLGLVWGVRPEIPEYDTKAAYTAYLNFEQEVGSLEDW